MREDYINRLTSVYEHYYCAKEGFCKWFDQCRASIIFPDIKFASDRAKVGLKYGENGYPRIVFVGLEGLDDKGIVQGITETSLDAANSHYKGVRFVADYLYSGIIGGEKPVNALKRTLIKYRGLEQYFALTNLYKCAFSRGSSGLPHTAVMKENCQKIFFDEIEALEPEILIIQVKSNRPEGFEEELARRYGSKSEYHIAGDTYSGAFSCSFPSGKPFILVWTYHGAGDPNPRKRAWVNDNKNGNEYINNTLIPILDKVIEKWNGRTIRTEDGYLSDEAMQMLRKRLEEEKTKSGDGKKPVKKSAKKLAQKPEEKPF